MSPPLDEIELLARSDHRVEVLNALAGRPCDRNGLRATTGASSPTMGRILSAFEERRWIIRNGHTYELTQLGEFVAERFAVYTVGTDRPTGRLRSDVYTGRYRGPPVTPLTIIRPILVTALSQSAVIEPPTLFLELKNSLAKKDVATRELLDWKVLT